MVRRVVDQCGEPEVASVAGDDVRSGQMSGSFSEGFSRTVSLTLATNRVYTVSMFADAQAAATEVGALIILLGGREVGDNGLARRRQAPPHRVSNGF